MHPVLGEHPRIVELDAKLADLQQAERASKERVARLVEPYHQKLAEWQVEADETVLRGQEPPPQPEEPDLGRDQHAAHMFLRRRGELHAERRRVVGEIAGEVEGQIIQREGELRARVSELLAQLEPLRVEYGELLAAGKQVRVAADADVQVRPSRSSRMRDRVDMPALVELAAGKSVLDLSAVQPQHDMDASAPEPRRRPEDEERLTKIMRDQRMAMMRGRTL